MRTFLLFWLVFFGAALSAAPIISGTNAPHAYPTPTDGLRPRAVLPRTTLAATRDLLQPGSAHASRPDELHPLRVFVNCGSTYVDNHAGTAVDANSTALTEATCALTNAFPTALRDSFATCDYATYPALYFTDRSYASNWAFEAMHQRVKDLPQDYYLYINKEITPETGRAAFKIALNLPVTGPFSKLNAALIAVVQSDVLKAIEADYTANADMDKAEVAGVKKLEEIIKAILGNTFATTLTEEMLLKMGFLETPPGPGPGTLTNTTSTNLSSNVRDYAGFDGMAAAAEAAAALLTNVFLSTKIVITDNDNYGTGTSSDFQKASSDFASSATKGSIWYHIFEKDGTIKVFFKYETRMTKEEAVIMVNAAYDRFNTNTSITAKHYNETPEKGVCPDYTFNAKWRAKESILPCYEYQGILITTGPAAVRDFGVGVLCGIIDGFIGDLSFLGIAGNFLNETITHTPFTFSWFLDMGKKVWEARSITQGILNKTKEDGLFWKNIALGLRGFVSNISGVITLLYHQVIEFLQIITFQKGVKEAGYAAGEKIYEVLINIIIPGSAVGKRLIKASEKAIKEMGEAVAGQAGGIMTLMRDKFKGKLPEFNTCRILGGGCFVAGTLIATPQGTQAIEKIQPGDPVIAHRFVNNRTFVADEAAGTAVFAGVRADAYTSEGQKQADAQGYDRADLWKIDLALTKADGTPTEVTLLRAKAWIDEHQIAGAGDQTLLSMPEMGVQGLATVTGVLPHPPVSHGAVWAADTDYTTAPVTGIFRHRVSEIISLRWHGGDTTGVTSTHPFFSTDRGDWIPAGGLYPGERVLAYGKPQTLEAVKIWPGERTVYNLEVGGVHNFLVGDRGMVVHNGCAKTLYSILNVMNLDHELILGKKWTHKARKTDKLDTPADLEEIRIGEIVGEQYQSNVFLAPKDHPGFDAIKEDGTILSFKGMNGATGAKEVTNLASNISEAFFKYKEKTHKLLPDDLKDKVKCDVWLSGKHASGAEIQSQWSQLLTGNYGNMVGFPMIGKIFYISPDNVVHSLY